MSKILDKYKKLMEWEPKPFKKTKKDKKKMEYLPELLDNKELERLEDVKRQLSQPYTNLPSNIPKTTGLGQALGQYHTATTSNPAIKKIPNRRPYSRPNDVSNSNAPLIIRQDIVLKKAKDILIPILETNIVPFLWGPPGLGKSSIVREIAEDKKWELIDLRLSLLNPVDLRGLPSINHKQQSAKWLPPSFLPDAKTKKRGILFLDEINLAPLSVQSAAYQLILDKKLGDYEFPKTWRIIAAGNREEDKANVYKISAPLANRFIHFNVKPDFLSWKEWAIEHHIQAEIIDFLMGRPSLLLKMPNGIEKAFPSPRTWEFVSQMMNAFSYYDTKNISPELNQAIVGLVGRGTAQEFMQYLQEFDLQAVSQQVKVFIKTGKINLPLKPESIRFAIIGAVLRAKHDNEIDEKKWNLFTKKLTEEEMATIEAEEKGEDFNEILEEGADVGIEGW